VEILCRRDILGSKCYWPFHHCLVAQRSDDALFHIDALYLGHSAAVENCSTGESDDRASGLEEITTCLESRRSR